MKPGRGRSASGFVFCERLWLGSVRSAKVRFLPALHFFGFHTRHSRATRQTYRNPRRAAACFSFPSSSEKATRDRLPPFSPLCFASRTHKQTIMRKQILLSPETETTGAAPAETPAASQCNCQPPFGTGLNHTSLCPESLRIAKQTHAENKAEHEASLAK